MKPKTSPTRIPEQNKIPRSSTEHRGHTAFLPPLQTALAILPYPLPTEALEKLAFWLGEMQHWNQVHNLTGFENPDDLINHHVLDPLSLVPFISWEGRLLDVGSGAGIPGIPLALYAAYRGIDLSPVPLQTTLLEPNQKRVNFLRHIQGYIQLPKVDIVAQRAEQWHPPILFDQIICRAVSDMKTFWQNTQHLGNPECRWLAMKGTYPKEELAALPPEVHLREVHRLEIHGWEAERHLVVLQRA